jgi:hypothetical protein
MVAKVLMLQADQRKAGEYFFKHGWLGVGTHQLRKLPNQSLNTGMIKIAAFMVHVGP